MTANRDTAVWRPFVWAALTLSVAGGFGLGGFLFLAEILRVPSGRWWPAAGQAHGHIQIVGWASLMVLGIGFHFLPRLIGVPLLHPVQAGAVLVLFLSGLVLRLITQPTMALAASSDATPVLRAGLAGSGLLELVAGTLALAILGHTFGRAPALHDRAAVWAIVPFFVVAFCAFWLALLVNLIGLAMSAHSGTMMIPGRIDHMTNELALYGFLIPIAVAMSARTFPLALRTPTPHLRPLRAGLALGLAGLALRLIGELAEHSVVVSVGQLLQAIALVMFAFGVGVFARRRRLPRQQVRLVTDPIPLHAVTAWLWLMGAAVLLSLSSFATLGVVSMTLPVDAEWHVLGAGFITLLILGVGAHLLPGFSRRPFRMPMIVWATLLLANAAAILRTGPLFLPDVPSPVRDALLGTAGIVGVAALALFGVNVMIPRRRGIERGRTGA